MKALATTFLLGVSTLTSLAQADLPLTNDVPVVDYGMRMAFCNADFDFTNSMQIVAQRELRADADVQWFLYNTTTNTFLTVIYLGQTNSFDFRLFNANGTEIPKTAKGKAMSVGPKSLTSLKGNPNVYYQGQGLMDFPKLTDLFHFPSKGIYVLEVRYWGWSNLKQQFSLSEPVRLRVIKEDKDNTPAPR